ncbi:MAG: tRNA lysidine(34) synthetase TilS [Hominenteromicrobium sp.]
MKAESVLGRMCWDFPETGKIIIGLSGGADSVLLTYLLLQKYGPERLHAVHVNHQIRGAEADADEAFVSDYCGRLKIPLTVFRENVPLLAQKSGEGLEACARRVRYACFDRLVSAPDDCIATAHNADDNTETILLNLARGMGPNGAAGIPALRGRIRRPMLRVSRTEVEFLCSVYGLSYVTDSTNAETVYTRNRLRHTVVPELKAVNPQLTQAVSRFSESMALQNAFVRGEAQRLLEAAECPCGYTLAVLRGAHRAVLRAALEIILAPLGRLSSEHLLQAETCVLEGGSATLPGGVQLTAKQDTLTIVSGAPQSFCVPAAGEKTPLPNGKTLIISKKFINCGAKNRNVHNLLFKNLLDCDRITGVPVIRTRRAGDCFAPAGRGVTKPVKKLLNEMRIPAAYRAELLLLELDGRIIWIEGAGAAEGFAFRAAEGWALEITVQTQSG